MDQKAKTATLGKDEKLLIFIHPLLSKTGEYTRCFVMRIKYNKKSAYL